MTENVVGIRGAPVPQVMPAREDVIRVLEDILERARAGDILGVHAVVQHNDECCGVRRAGLLSYRALGFAHAMASEMLTDLSKL